MAGPGLKMYFLPGCHVSLGEGRVFSIKIKMKDQISFWMSLEPFDRSTVLNFNSYISCVFYGTVTVCLTHTSLSKRTSHHFGFFRALWKKHFDHFHAIPKAWTIYKVHLDSTTSCFIGSFFPQLLRGASYPTLWAAVFASGLRLR